MDGGSHAKPCKKKGQPSVREVSLVSGRGPGGAACARLLEEGADVPHVVGRQQARQVQRGLGGEGLCVALVDALHAQHDQLEARAGRGPALDHLARGTSEPAARAEKDVDSGVGGTRSRAMRRPRRMPSGAINAARWHGPARSPPLSPRRRRFTQSARP
jgi:hypothetical protein